VKTITYPGTSNSSQFTYDGLAHVVDIVETRSGTVTSTKQFVWCGDERCEARNAGGSITAQYFRYGQTISSTNYFYSKDHLGSLSEMTDSSGNVQASYQYDSYGRAKQLQGSLASDFQYAGYYFHAPSGLNLNTYRAYSPIFGRWISRDPIGEVAGTDLYTYVGSTPIDSMDPSGLADYRFQNLKCAVIQMLIDSRLPTFFEKWGERKMDMRCHGPIPDPQHLINFNELQNYLRDLLIAYSIKNCGPPPPGLWKYFTAPYPPNLPWNPGTYPPGYPLPPGAPPIWSPLVPLLPLLPLLPGLA
jgi:RHS repeat-associated protein